MFDKLADVKCCKINVKGIMYMYILYLGHGYNIHYN